MEKDKNRKRNIRWILIFVATAFIVAASVNIGIQISNYLNENKKDNESSLSKKEETKDFKIDYKEETYKLENSNKKTIVENKRNLPIITSEKYQEQADKIVYYLTQISDKKWEEIKLSSDDYRKLDLNDKVGINYSINSVEQTDKYFTFKLTTSGSLGGIGWDDEEAYTFDIKTGSVLELANISSDVDGLKQYLANGLNKYLSEQDYSKDLDKDYNNKIIIELNKLGNWYLDKDGLHFVFKRYTFGPGYIGLVRFNSSYEDINNFLLEDYKK